MQITIISIFLFLLFVCCQKADTDKNEQSVVDLSTIQPPNYSPKNTREPEDLDSNGFSKSKLIEINDSIKDKIKYKTSEAKDIIKDIAKDVVNILTNKDLDAFISYIHPEKGIRFTLYETPQKSDPVFNRTQIRQNIYSDNMFVWGTYRNSGKLFSASMSGFFNGYLFKQFIKVKAIGYNEIITINDFIETQFDFYPDSIIIEYYFPGEGEFKYHELYWEGFRIVFEKYQGTWFIVGILKSRKNIG